MKGVLYLRMGRHVKTTRQNGISPLFHLDSRVYFGKV